jgi:hypothetical protein
VPTHDDDEKKTRLELLEERLAAADPDDMNVEIPQGFLHSLLEEQQQITTMFQRYAGDKRRLMPKGEFKARMMAIAQEVMRDASFEGRVEWSIIDGIDGEEVPADQVAVRMAVRTGNDMGQGGMMLVDRDVEPPKPEEGEETT